MRRERFTAFQVGLIAAVLIVIGVFLAFTKDIPFTKPYELKAVFENAPPIQKNQAVRIAGVDVGKVSGVEALGGDSPAVEVTMKLDDEALPIHENAEVKVRPRIFFEGNLFMDVRPGTPDSPEAEDGYTIPASQTSAPVQIDQVLGTLQTNTREDLQKLLIGYGEAINGEPQPGEDDDQVAEVQGLTAAEALNKSLDYSADSLRDTAIVNQALLGTEVARPVEADRQPAEDLRRARLAREPAQGASSPTSTRPWGRSHPRRATCARRSPSCPRCSRRPTPRSTTSTPPSRPLARSRSRSSPAYARRRPRSRPASPGSARPALCCRSPSCRGW